MIFVLAAVDLNIRTATVSTKHNILLTARGEYSLPLVVKIFAVQLLIDQMFGKLPKSRYICEPFTTRPN